MIVLGRLGVGPFTSKIEPASTVYIAATIACLLPTAILGVFYAIGARKQEPEPEACRRLGLRLESNLSDEHDERYSASKHKGVEPAGKVKSLWTYPVKSCRGVELGQGTIYGSGMEYDRQFSFAQLTSKFPAGLDDSREEKAKHTWKFITQRTIPAMATIKTEVWVPDPTASTYSKEHHNVESQGVIVLKFPSVASESKFRGGLWDMMKLVGGKPEKAIHIPFNPTQEQVRESNYTLEDMEIWKDKPTSLLIASTETSNSWIQDLRQYLGITNHLALFRVRPEHPREVYRCAPRRDELGYQSTVGFQDAYPLHILNLASVQDVAKNMGQGAPPIGARNFRPNIVFVGDDAYAEDSWKRIKIGEFEYHVPCRTVRCLLPNVNPATGVRHGSEPNKTLKKFRRIDEGDPNNACLGMQMVPAAEESKIKVGDAITVLENGEHFYVKQ